MDKAFMMLRESGIKSQGEERWVRQALCDWLLECWVSGEFGPMGYILYDLDIKFTALYVQAEHGYVYIGT